MVIFVGLAAIVVVTGVFLAAIMSALITAERRSSRHVDQLEHKIDRLIETNMSRSERTRALNHRKRIEEQNRRAHGIYSH